MNRKKRKNNLGFTLIELVMVILLVGLLAAVAIPEFIDFRTDAKNAATKGALGTLRASIAVSRAAIAMREASTTPNYPTALEFQGNAFDGSHPVLSGTNIVDASSGIPNNPWSLDTLPVADTKTVMDCDGVTKSYLESTANFTDMGWCYNPTSGTIWANSDRNGGAAGSTENAF